MRRTKPAAAPGETQSMVTRSLTQHLYLDGSIVRAEDVALRSSVPSLTRELPGGPTYNQRYFLEGDPYKVRSPSPR